MMGGLERIMKPCFRMKAGLFTKGTDCISESMISHSMDKYYQVLGLRPGASLKEIRQAYRDLARVWHPDRFVHDARLYKLAEEKLKEINVAYEALERGMSPGQLGRHADVNPDRTSRSPSEEEKAHAGSRAERKNGPHRPQQKEQASRHHAPARTEQGEPIFLSVILVFAVIVVVFLYFFYPAHPPDKAGVERAVVDSMPGDTSRTKSIGQKGPVTVPASSGLSRDAGVRIASHTPPHKAPSKPDVSKQNKAVRLQDAPQDTASIQMPSGAMENVEILEHAKVDVSPTWDEERSGGTRKGGNAGKSQDKNWRYLGRTQNGEFCFDVSSVQHLTPSRFAFWIRIKILGYEKIRQTLNLKKHTAQYASLTYLLGYNEIDTEQRMWRQILVNYTDERHFSLHTWNVPEKWNYIPDHSVIEKALKEIKGTR